MNAVAPLAQFDGATDHLSRNATSRSGRQTGSKLVSGKVENARAEAVWLQDKLLTQVPAHD